MNLSDVRFESSMGRLDSMQALVNNYMTDVDVLNDLARHAICIAVKAQVGQFFSSDSDLLCKISCEFNCHFEKIAKRLQIKNGAIASNDSTCCEFSTEDVIIPQILSMVTEMRDCLLAGINVMSIGDKSVLGEIAACLDETIYCLTQCLTNPAS